MTKLLYSIIPCVLVCLEAVAGAAINEIRDGSIVSGLVAQTTSSPPISSSQDAQTTIFAEPVVNTQAAIETITVAPSQTSSNIPSSSGPATSSITAAAAAVTSDLYPQTILIDTSSQVQPKNTATSSASPAASAVSSKDSKTQSNNLLKIVIPIVAVIALIFTTGIFVYLIRLKYKYRRDPTPTQDREHARAWPETRGYTSPESYAPTRSYTPPRSPYTPPVRETYYSTYAPGEVSSMGSITSADRETKARFSFISQYSETSRYSRFPSEQPYYTSDKPLPKAPAIDIEGKRMNSKSLYNAYPAELELHFSPQELEGSQVDLMRYSHLDEKKPTSFF